MAGCSMAGRTLAGPLSIAWMVTVYTADAPTPPVQSRPAVHAADLFQTADTCMVCHNNLVTPSGQNVSMGTDWRATMMANSARDPYWQASVRREIMDHPEARAAIEDECSICHMPMSTFAARAGGGHGEIFAHLPIGQGTAPDSALAADGVSCAICHQVQPDRLGTPESFTGGYVIDTARPDGERAIFGPFAVDAGRTRLMRSATGFVPTEATHLQSSEVCATCHTLYTTALGPTGQTIGRLPEQMPFLEWRHSAYRSRQTCQDCHMPVVTEPVAIAGVLGQPREGVRRHVFRGGNVFMLRLLNRYRDELGVAATPQEMEQSIARTIDHLQSSTARVAMGTPSLSAGRLTFDVAVQNLAGHKLPSAYPSRRVWLHVRVQDAAGRAVFESGAGDAQGRVAGNDNDLDPMRFEPHYTRIERPDQVQIYESIMAGTSGALTTGLLTGVRYAKDNRLLPEGFDKATAPADVAVHGEAATDADFQAAGDRVQYAVDVGAASGPLRIEVRLTFQPIAFRWADNLRAYDAPETRRFVRYWDSMAGASSVVLASATAEVGR
jgi:hypothetical protein